MAFWFIAIAAAAIAAFIAARPLLTGRAATAPRAEHDAQVFRDQLKELERDVARGAVSEADAEGTRLEISRRLLAADAESRATEEAKTAPRAASRALAVILVVVAPLSAAWIYSDIGSPGAEDMPLASRSTSDRPSQEEALRMMAGREAPEPTGPAADEFRDLLKKVEAKLAENPNDTPGIRAYANGLMNLSRFPDAAVQFRKLVDLEGENADTRSFMGYAELMIFSVGGYVSPEAEEALLQVLKREPTNPSARYYLGYFHAQNDRVELAAAIWQRLLEDSNPNDPWVAPIQQQLAAMAPKSQPPMTGPTPQDIENAGAMPEGDRQEMIRSMVSQLHERLLDEGKAGDVNEWAKLMRSYNVLGDSEAIMTAYEEATAIFSDDSIALAALKQMALLNGAEIE